jgi:hypothetical protein
MDSLRNHILFCPMPRLSRCIVVLLLVTIGFVAWQYELRLDAENTLIARQLAEIDVLKEILQSVIISPERFEGN